MLHGWLACMSIDMFCHFDSDFSIGKQTLVFFKQKNKTDAYLISKQFYYVLTDEKSHCVIIYITFLCIITLFHIFDSIFLLKNEKLS